MCVKKHAVVYQGLDLQPYAPLVWSDHLSDWIQNAAMEPSSDTRASASPLPPLPLGLVLHAWACLPLTDLLKIQTVSTAWRESYANNSAQLRELRR
jgi:hypothetical protein